MSTYCWFSSNLIILLVLETLDQFPCWLSSVHAGFYLRKCSGLSQPDFFSWFCLSSHTFSLKIHLCWFTSTSKLVLRVDFLPFCSCWFLSGPPYLSLMRTRLVLLPPCWSLSGPSTLALALCPR